MSSKIKVLPEDLMNQIAAGEVIERPASVVKELVENSIDAAASYIDVELEAAGIQKIKVIDDGVGMSPEDVRLSLQRHATSKIKNLDDLFHVSTLGFRGEALPSIASVSQLTLQSKPKDQLEAFSIQLLGGQKIKEGICGAATGTHVVVENLFFNTPARKKFLKAKQTELSHVIDTLQVLALSYPQIGFRLLHEGKEVFLAPKTKNHLERVLQILKLSQNDLFTVEQQTYPWKLLGYVSDPKITAATTRYCYFFIKGRPIRDRTLLHAVTMAYQNLIPNRMYPKVVLFLSCEGGEVDVNVHPTKKEVRFRDLRFMHSFVSQSIRKRVEAAAQDNLLSYERGGFFEKAKRDSLQHLQEYLSEGHRAGRAGMVFQRKINRDSPPTKGTVPIYFPFEKSEASLERRFPARPARPAGKSDACLKIDIPADVVEQRSYLPFDTQPSFKYLGQIKNSYLVCEKEGQVLFIDQHAAHERILFEKIKKDWASKKLQKQALLIPLQLELSKTQMGLLDQIEPELKNFGFEISSFGGNTILIQAIPERLNEKVTLKFIGSIIEELSVLPKSQFAEKFLDKFLATLSCHSARTAHEALTPQEAQNLLKEVFQLKTALHCPHGRPFLHAVHIADIEKKFKR